MESVEKIVMKGLYQEALRYKTFQEKIELLHCDSSKFKFYHYGEPT